MEDRSELAENTSSDTKMYSEEEFKKALRDSKAKAGREHKQALDSLRTRLDEEHEAVLSHVRSELKNNVEQQAFYSSALAAYESFMSEINTQLLDSITEYTSDAVGEQISTHIGHMEPVQAHQWLRICADLLPPPAKSSAWSLPQVPPANRNETDEPTSLQQLKEVLAKRPKA